MLVAEIVQRLSGRSIRDFVRDEIIKPLGLKSTGLGSLGFARATGTYDDTRLSSWQPRKLEHPVLARVRLTGGRTFQHTAGLRRDLCHDA